MGKATIKTNLGEGKYLVDLAMNTGLKAPALVKIDAQIAAKESHLPTVQSALDKQASETARLQAVKAGIISEIESFQTALAEKKDTLTGQLASADTAVSNAQSDVGDAEYLIGITQSSLASLEAEKAATPTPSPELLAAIAVAQAEILVNQADIDAKKIVLADAKKARDGIQSQIDNLKSEIPKEMTARMGSAIAAIQASLYVESLYKIEQAQTKLDINAYKLGKAAIEKLPDTKELTVWCADYTADLTGDVATIDIPGEVGAIPTLLKPGFVPAPYSKAADGEMVSLELMGPEQAWFNLCILPYLNKWRPKYRRGHITSFTGELAEVELEETFTKYHAVEVTPKGKAVLKAVPVQYMECNSDAFEVGDFVIVEFTDRDPEKPKVVGFVENPRECNFHGFGIKSGETVRLIQKKAAVWKIRDKPELKYGTLYRKIKIGEKWTVVSFDGPTAGVMVGTRPGWAGDIATFTTANIYINGRSLSAPGKVEGLGLCNVGGFPFVYIVANFSIYRAGIPARVNAKTVLNWALMGSYGPPYDYELYITNNPAWTATAVQASLWEFNADCTEAAAVFGPLNGVTFGAATIIGRWTGYDTLALEWLDASAGSVRETVTVTVGDAYRVGEMITGDGHYYSLQKHDTLVWCGFNTNGFDLDIISLSIDDIRQTPDGWSGFMDDFGTVFISAYYYHDVPEGVSNRQGSVEFTNTLKLNGSGIYLYQFGSNDIFTLYSQLKYLDPSIMAYAVVGYDGDTPYCDILKDNIVILSGDNLSKNTNPPTYDKFSTFTSAWSKSINNDTAYSQIDKNHYQAIEDTSGNIIACIYDYSEVHNFYNEFTYGYSKSAMLTDGDIHALAGGFDTIMPIGLI